MKSESHRKTFVSYLGYVLICLMFGVSIAGRAQAQINEDDLEYLIDVVFGERTADIRTLKNCAYTQRTTTSNVGSMQERYDPGIGLGLEWQLLFVNGEDPTDQQLNNYEPKSRERHPAVLNFEFIDIDSLQLQDRSQSQLRFTFKVIPSQSTGLNQHVSNQLTIDRNSGELVELKSFTTEPFRIQPWMQVQEYESVSTFRFEEQTNGSVLEQLAYTLKVNSGKQTLQREVSLQFSDFDCTNRTTDESPIETERDEPTDEVDIQVPRDTAPSPSIR